MDTVLTPYHHRRQVMFYDTDAGGVVHNLAYLRHIEEARTLFAAERLGMDFAAMAEAGEFPVLTRTEIDYLRPGRLGDTLRIEGRLASIERVRFHLEFDLFRDADDTLLTRCFQSLALVTMPAGRPLRLPPVWDAWREALRSASRTLPSTPDVGEAGRSGAVNGE